MLRTLSAYETLKCATNSASYSILTLLKKQAYSIRTMKTSGLRVNVKYKKGALFCFTGVKVSNRRQEG
jgi:uncharacterized protein YggE